MTTDDSFPMAAKEKAAWVELLVSIATITIVLAFLPFAGDSAARAFGLLGFVICGAFFVYGRKKRMLADERDWDIETRSVKRGVEAAWMFLVIAMILCVLTPIGEESSRMVGKSVLNWLIWIQFWIYFVVKGASAVVYYRRQNHAT